MQVMKDFQQENHFLPNGQKRTLLKIAGLQMGYRWATDGLEKGQKAKRPHKVDVCYQPRRHGCLVARARFELTTWVMSLAEPLRMCIGQA